MKFSIAYSWHEKQKDNLNVPWDFLTGGNLTDYLVQSPNFICVECEAQKR